MRSKLVFVAVAVVLPAAALLLRQSDDALMRASSALDALVAVATCSAPGLLVYVLGVRNPSAVRWAGALLVGLLTVQWWAVATDEHSTASIGPFMLGWFVLPVAVSAVDLGFSRRARPR